MMEATMNELVFGRHPTCNVRVDDEYASPRHCRVFEDIGRFYVEDLGTTNGTWIVPETGPERRLRLGERAQLRTGDRIRIGRTTLPWRVNDDG